MNVSDPLWFSWLNCHNLLHNPTRCIHWKDCILSTGKPFVTSLTWIYTQETSSSNSRWLFSTWQSSVLSPQVTLSVLKNLPARDFCTSTSDVHSSFFAPRGCRVLLNHSVMSVAIWQRTHSFSFPVRGLDPWVCSPMLLSSFRLPVAGLSNR